MPNNNAYGDTAGRLNCEGGPTGTQRHRPSDPTGERMTDTKYVLRAETRGGQYAKKGWDKYELPTDNHGAVDPDDLPEAYARGGNAGAGYNPADYPGGTTA